MSGASHCRTHTSRLLSWAASGRCGGSHCRRRSRYVHCGLGFVRLLYVMVVLAHDCRRILHTAVTEHLTVFLLSRQVTEVFPWDSAPRYLLRDRDASYGAEFCKLVETMGITEVITAPRSPWQNAYVERVIGSIRRECLNHIVIFNERHLRRVLTSRRLLPSNAHASFTRPGLP
jgi:transposase InsO family protein